jgi:oligopeptide transport system permease protein
MSAVATAARGATKPRVRSSPLRDAWNRFRRNRAAFVGAIIAIIILLTALLAPVITPYAYDYSNLSETLLPPGPGHLFGTDEVGRDLFTRIVYGARTSMTVGIFVPAIGALIGVPLGAAAGWFGRTVDFVVLRLVEAATAVPAYLVALLLISIYGSGLFHVALFLGVVSWVGYARLTRAQFIALRDREFVTAARAIGTPSWRIMLQHILPNAAGPIIVVFVLGIPGAVFGEAGYSFLGLGVQDPIPSWGKMITEGEQYMRIDPLFALLPIVCIALTMLSFSFVGDGLRDALDPNALE